MQNWNPQKKQPPVTQVNSYSPWYHRNRRSFAAILCLKGRSACLCLQQQRKQLLMKVAQLSCGRRNWKPGLVPWLMHCFPHPLPVECTHPLLLKCYVNPLVLFAANTIYVFVYRWVRRVKSRTEHTTGKSRYKDYIHRKAAHCSGLQHHVKGKYQHTEMFRKITARTNIAYKTTQLQLGNTGSPFHCLRWSASGSLKSALKPV